MALLTPSSVTRHDALLLSLRGGAVIQRLVTVEFVEVSGYCEFLGPLRQLEGVGVLVN